MTDIMVIVVLFLMIFGAIAAGQIAGRQKAQIVINIIDEKVIRWEKSGVDQQRIKERADTICMRLSYIKAHQLSKAELAKECKRIVDDVETYI